MRPVTSVSKVEGESIALPLFAVVADRSSQPVALPTDGRRIAALDSDVHGASVASDLKLNLPALSVYLLVAGGKPLHDGVTVSLLQGFPEVIRTRRRLAGGRQKNCQKDREACLR